jgi:nucleotide-binding universal stress UspA family protein
MFKRILIVTDLTGYSNAVIKCMNDFKTLEVEEVTLFYACGESENTSISDYIKYTVEPHLKAQQKLIEIQGFKANIDIVSGSATDELALVAKRRGISLIVMGSNGVDLDKRFLYKFGNIPTEILHIYEKPLLILRVDESISSESTVDCLCYHIKEKVLFSTDFSNISFNAFEYVVKLVEGGCKRVTLMHVKEDVDADKPIDRIGHDKLEIRKQLLLGKGAEEVEIKFLHGKAANEIVKESKNGYSLIVMGSQGKGFLHEIFVGSVSKKVAKETDVSILLIPTVER